MLKSLHNQKFSTKNKLNKNTQIRISLEKEVYKQFKSRYSNDKNFYNKKISNEIISNETAHIVALFKDYLISDDNSEFLQRYYDIKESKKKLQKIFDYYVTCSVIFPNYVILYEAKYICKNIQRKQRLIDNQQMQEEELEKKKKEINVLDTVSDDNVFDTKVYDSLNHITETNSVIQKAFGKDSQGYSPSDKDDSCCRILSSIDKCDNLRNRQISMIGLKGDFNTVVNDKVATTLKKTKNFFLNNFVSTDANKSKDKVTLSKANQEFLNSQSPLNILFKKQNKDIFSIPLNNQNATKKGIHKNTFSMPKLSPKIVNTSVKQSYLIKTIEENPNHKKIMNTNQYIITSPNNNNNNQNDFIPLTSRREIKKPKINLKTELYELIATKFRKNPNISKKTIANLSTATPSLSLKTNHHHNQQSQPKQSNNGAVLLSNQLNSNNSHIHTNENRKKSHDHLYDKYKKKSYPSGKRNTRNGMINKINDCLFLYESPSLLTEIFKTTSTRQLTFSNDLEKRTERAIKTLHIKGFDEMLQSRQRRMTACHSNRDKGKSKVQDSINNCKSKSKR